MGTVGNANTCDDKGVCECQGNVIGHKCNTCTAGNYPFPTCDTCIVGYYNFPACTKGTYFVVYIIFYLNFPYISVTQN